MKNSHKRVQKLLSVILALVLMTGFLSAGAAQAEETDGAVDSVVQDTAYPGDGDTSEDAQAAQDSGDTDLEDEQGALSEDEADDTAALPENEDASGEDTGEALSEEEAAALLLADLRDTVTRMLSAAVTTLDLVQTLAGGNITEHIELSGGTLTTTSGTEVKNEGTVTCPWGYTFKAKWSSSKTIEAGDYFIFSVPAIFGKITNTIDIIGSDGTVWGTVTFKADDSNSDVSIATATFNSNVEDQTTLSGTITLTAQYLTLSEGEPLTWTFGIDSYEYEYNLTSAIEKKTMKDITADLFKSGEYAGNGLYKWSVFLNESKADWGTDTVTVTDTIGIGHKLTTYSGSPSINSARGYYGLDDSTTMYFRIWVVDWDKMRDDYNEAYGENGTKSIATTPCVYPASSTGYTVYDFYKDTSSSPTVYPANIPSGIVTNYMKDSALYFADETGTMVTGYRYVTPYTGTVTTEATDDNGFKLVFPDGTDTQSLYVVYYTTLTAVTDPGSLTNGIEVSGPVPARTSASAVGSTVFATGTSGKISLYKSNAYETAYLEGAAFTLEYQGDATVETSVLDRRTAGTTGYLCFDLSEFGLTAGAYAGDYLLTEVTAPDGYTVLTDSVTLTLDDNGYITVVNGNSVSGGGTFDGVRVDSTGLLLTVHNDKEPSSVDVTLDGTKTLNGRLQAAEEFSFLLKDSDNELLQTVQNTENGTFQFEALTFYDEGTYIYTVRESDGTLGGVGYDTTVYTVTIEVTENSGALEADVSYSVDGDTKGAINFTNTYSAVGSLTLTGEKSLSGRTQTAGEFTFTVVEDNGTTAATGANQADGAILFSAFEYKYDTTNGVDDRGTHIYTVKEAAGTATGVTYDTAVYTVEVEVTDDGYGGLSAAITAITKDGVDCSTDDPLSFTNSYSSGSKGGGGGGTTTTPTPTPTTPTSATPEPSTEPTPTATVTPGDGTGTTATPSTNDTQLPAAPEPANPGSTLVLNETGTGYIEIGADGTPLGTWTVGDDGVWIFSEAVPLGDYVAVTSGSAGVSGIPQTGDPVPLTLLVVILCLSGGALLLLLFTGRKKKE